MSKFITDLITNNPFTIAWIILVLIVITVITIMDIVNKRNKYAIWKKQTINLGIYTREWERTEDELLMQLFDENKRLEDENKAFKQKYRKLSFFVFLWVLFTMIYHWFNNNYRHLKDKS